MLQYDLDSRHRIVTSFGASSMGDQLHDILFIHPARRVGRAIGKFVPAFGKNEHLTTAGAGVIKQETKEIEKPKPEWYRYKKQCMYGRVAEQDSKGKY